MKQEVYEEILLIVLFLDNWVFDSLILTDELLGKDLWRSATCLLVNINLCGKWVSSSELPITFDDSFKIASVSFFTANFNLLSCEFDTFTFKLSYWVILYWNIISIKFDIIFKKNYIIVQPIGNTLTVPCEKSKTVYFASS